MGLLEELEHEAQKRRLSGDEAARLKTERETIYRTQLEPALDALNAFLGELINKLKTLQPRIAMHYHVPGYGEIAGYIEHEYRLGETRQPSSREITLDFACAIATDECPTVDIEGANRVRALAGFFQRQRIGGMLAPRKDAAGELVAATFRAKGRIALRAHFQADAESGALRMSFSNLDGFDTVMKSIPAAQIDDVLYDQIGRFLVRDPNTLLREDLPDAYRKHLRSKVEQHALKRRWEIRISERREAELADLRRSYSAAGKLGAWLDRMHGIGGTLDRLRGIFKRRTF